MISDILNWAASIPSWMEDAACTSGDLEMWFSSNPHEIRAAKKVCRDCPVRLLCLKFAYENNERSGVWGGLTAEQRVRALNKAKREAVA